MTKDKRQKTKDKRQKTKDKRQKTKDVYLLRPKIQKCHKPLIYKGCGTYFLCDL